VAFRGVVRVSSTWTHKIPEGWLKREGGGGGGGGDCLKTEGTYVNDTRNIIDLS
jgi:hypothetical protein